VYCDASPAVQASLHAAHGSAFPVFYGAVPAAWAGAWAFRDETDFTDAYRLTVVQLTTFGVVTALKRAVGRPRPYMTQPLVSRSSRYRAGREEGAFESFPSGHASLSVALATSWSLSHPRWFVIAPSAVWATAVTVSRLHLGVHYPSDVLAGAVLGAGIATAVHLLRDTITPDALTPEAKMMDGPSVTVRVQL
jgi:membrane-associated phospholipid phosphatase